MFSQVISNLPFSPLETSLEYNLSLTEPTYNRMLVRVPIRVLQDDGDSVFTIGTHRVEYGENVEPEGSTDLLPAGAPTTGSLAEDIITVLENHGYSPESFDPEEANSKLVMWGVVMEYPEDADGDDWIEFEEVEDGRGS